MQQNLTKSIQRLLTVFAIFFPDIPKKYFSLIRCKLRSRAKTNTRLKKMDIYCCNVLHKLDDERGIQLLNYLSIAISIILSMEILKLVLERDSFFYFQGNNKKRKTMQEQLIKEKNDMTCQTL